MNDIHDLMVEYDGVDSELAEESGHVAALKQRRASLRELLKDAVLNAGLGRGSKVELPDLGSLHFTTQRHYRVPPEHRERFVQYIIDEGSIALLSMSPGDLASWCEDRKRCGVDVPEFVEYHEERFVPVITLLSAKVRRQQKARMKGAENNDE